jgi:NADH:ubiquinone oxidoreductase subunit F (NADH-binding)
MGDKPDCKGLWLDGTACGTCRPCRKAVRDLLAERAALSRVLRLADRADDCEDARGLHDLLFEIRQEALCALEDGAG